jgi:DNA-directed RNA polymerase specialized sigma24 family protein
LDCDPDFAGAAAMMKVQESTEEWGRLMAAAQAGDGAAYARLLHEVLPYVHAIALSRHAAPDRVADVTRDVLLTLHRIRHTYDPARPFTAWLGAIAHRRAADALPAGARAMPADQPEGRPA